MNIKDILSKDKLEDLYLIKKFSDAQIAKQYHLTLGQVQRLRNKYRIRTLEQYERHPILELNEREISVIIGTLLGDGHMRKRRGKRTYPQLMIEHSIKQKEYVFLLRSELDNWIFNKDKPIKINRKKHKNGKFYHSLNFQTICHPAFNEIYNNFYKSGKKILNIRILKRYFTLLSFAIWIMDDGFLSGNCKRIGIATNCFYFDEVKALKYFLERQFELKSWICKKTSINKISWELHFDKKSSIMISNMLDTLVIDSMKYKLLSETTKDAGKRT